MVTDSPFPAAHFKPLSKKLARCSGPEKSQRKSKFRLEDLDICFELQLLYSPG